LLNISLTIFKRKYLNSKENKFHYRWVRSNWRPFSLIWPVYISIDSMIPVTILLTSFEGCLYLTVWHITILHCQFTHDINVLWHNDCFWTFTTFVFELASATIEFIKPVFCSAIGWCFIDVLLLWKLWKRMARKCSRVNSIFLPM